MTRITITPWDKLPKAIEQTKKQAGTLQSRIHSQAASIMKAVHDKPERIVEAAVLLTALQNASSYHSNAFSKWMSAMLKDKDGNAVVLPFEWSKEKECWTVHKNKKITGKTFMAFRDNPFWEVSPPPKAKPFDFNAELLALVERAAKRMDKPKEGDAIAGAQVRAVRDLIQQEES